MHKEAIPLRKRRKIRIAFLAVALAVFIALLMPAAGCALFREKPQTLVFNEIESIYAASPMYYPDAASAEISVDEAKVILGVDVSGCLPKSLKDFRAYVSKEYFIPDELRSINIHIQDKAQEPGFGETIVLSIASKQWSQRSTTSIDYTYSGTAHKSSSVYGVTVDAYVRPPVVHENVETGYYSEEGAIYIAQFRINSLEYYVEGREGITETQFTAFVTNIIRSYNH